MKPMTIAVSLPSKDGSDQTKHRLASWCPPLWIIGVIVMFTIGLILAVYKPNGAPISPISIPVDSKENQDKTGGTTTNDHPGMRGHMDEKSNNENDGNDPKKATRGPTTQLTTVNSEKSLFDYYNGNDLTGAFAVENEHGLQYLAQKMLIKKKMKKPFIVGALGSGIIVGAFGNCRADGYLSLLERTVGPVFEAHGLEFKINVAAFGSFCGISSNAVASCAPSLLGEDVDLLHFSFPRSTDTAEMRLNLGTIASGSVHIIEPDCSGNAGSTMKGKNAKLLSTYSQYGSDVLCLEDALQNVMGESYKGQSWGLVGDGMHMSTRTSANAFVWRNWLPGPLGHQFLADATSMLLFRALKRMKTITDEFTTPSFNHSQLCHIVHSPHHGVDSLTSVPGKWRKLPGEMAADDDIPAEDRDDPRCEHTDECGYYEARGSSAGALVFKIPAQEAFHNRQVYVCCCCNAELCVDEQFKDYVQFTWKKPVTKVQRTDALQHRSAAVGAECLLVAKNMPFENELTISISSPSTNVPVRISAVITG